MKRNLVILIAVIALIGGSIASAEVVESYGANGAVDWSDRTVQAKGIAVQGGVGGRAGQIRAAELDALRQILETVKGMRISSETTVENFMLSSDVIRTRVEGVARNFRRVGDPVYMNDGSIEVTVEMDLTGPGRFFDVIIPSQIGGGSPVYTSPMSDARAFTGLVIDARGLGLRPAITPRVFDETGREIYGSRYVSRDWAIQYGMAGYAKTIDQAKSNDRVGDRPMVIEAVKATGANRTDLVIRDVDAHMLHAVSANFSFLQQCRVIILVD